MIRGEETNNNMLVRPGLPHDLLAHSQDDAV